MLFVLGEDAQVDLNFLRLVWDHLGGDPQRLSQVDIVGDVRLPSRLPVEALALGAAATPICSAS